MDSVDSDFFNDLSKLDKSDLINLITNFWSTLKTDAENSMKDETNYMAAEFGRVKMTQVNRLRILTKYKASNK